MTFNKFIAVLVMCMSLGMISNAAPVTVEQAQQEAANFVLKKQAAVRSLKMASCANKQLKAASTTSNEAAYYVFNIGENQGFVIVSGDDRTNPILGYSDEGYFDETKTPANMKAWLKEYAQQIALLDKIADADLDKALAAPKATKSTVNTRNSIAPLITTKWNQADPYWNMCPMVKNLDSDDNVYYDRAYTGCVATSMSQIMNYHKWPTQTTKEIPGYTTYNTLSQYANITDTVVNEAQPVTTFDWAHMKDSYNGSEDGVYTNAVAKLMRYVGCGVKMIYYPTASGANDPDIPIAFHEYFDYNAQLVYRSDYDQDTWNEMVYQELVAGRPMVYNGRAGAAGGHSFVCDGFEMGEYFHINWGWGGLGDGYFQLSILNPSAAGIGAASSSEGYNIDQTAIIGISPGYAGGSGSGEQVDHRLTVYNMYYSGSRTIYNEGDGFSFTKRRQVVVTEEDHIQDGTKYLSGIALYDNNDNFVEMIAYSTIASSSVSYTNKWPYDNSSTYYYFGKNLSNGTYKIKPVSQVNGSGNWLPMFESDRYYIEMTVSGTTATLVDHPLNDLTAISYEFVGDHKVGAAMQCNVTVRNNSVDRFMGKIYFYLDNEQVDEFGDYTTVVEAEIPANGTKVVTFNFSPKNSGTKSAKLSLYESSWGGNPLSGTGSVTIAAADTVVPMNLSVVIEATNAVDGVIYDTHARFKVDVTNNANGEYNRYLLAPLFIVEDGKGSMVTYQQTTLNIPAHTTVTLYYDFNDLAYGSTYALNMYGRNENDKLVNLVESGHSVYYDIRRGLVTWDGTSMVGTSGPASGNITIPSNALAASLEGLDITSVTPSGNPNTIYFIGESESVPSGLSGLNVVKGNTATSITLKDGYGYFIPQSFTAQSISYERTFSKVRTNGVAENWSTIVLPFTPSNVTNSSNLWVERFSQEADGEVVFSEVPQIEANVPYIIAAKNTGTFTWSATNVQLKAEPIAYTSGEQYLMAGTFINQSLENVYTVNSAGSLAKWASSNQSVAPFRAYFKEIEGLDSHVDIPLPGEASQQPAIEEVTLAELMTNGVDETEYIVTDNMAVVEAVQIAGKAFVTDGNNNWIQVITGDYYNTIAPMKSVGTLKGVFTGKNFIPTITLNEAPTTGNATLIVNPKNYNLAQSFEPQVNEVVNVTGFYNANEGALRGGYNSQGMKVSLDLSWISGMGWSPKNGDQYAMVAAVQIKEPWVSNAPALKNYDNVQDNYIIYPISVPIATGVDNLVIVASDQRVNVFNMQGQIIKKDVDAAAATQGLRPGIYLIGGRKVIVK